MWLVLKKAGFQAQLQIFINTNITVNIFFAVLHLGTPIGMGVVRSHKATKTTSTLQTASLV